MSKKTPRRTTRPASPAATAADIRSRVLTEVLRDIATHRAEAAGYDRTPYVHDRYGKAGAAGRGEIVSNPAITRTRATTRTGRGGRG